VDEASFDSLSADASALEAQIDRKVVRAPFSGRLGIRAVNLGQYLAPGTTLTVLESTESVYVDFRLPQQHLDVLRQGMTVRASLEKSGAKASEGSISAIEPAVDAVTRAVKVRAELPNSNGSLRPGMFVNVEVVLPDKRRVVAIPSTAVVHAAYGDSVFCAEPKKDAPAAKADKPVKLARQQFVRLGDVRGDFVAVLDGVSAGQEVVTSGAFKLRNGASLAVNNDVKLESQLAPRPENN
jgi:membrane fusion protein (multidrug efflux system)